MEAKTNYTIVGIVVVMLIAGLLSMALWLSVGFNQKNYNIYTVYMRESVAGLSNDSPVRFNGVKVGFVKEIKINKNDPRQVEILLSIEDGTPVTNSTTATLISQGITGITYVGLSVGSSDLTPLKRMHGEPYPVIPARPSLFNQLDKLLKEVADNINSLSKDARRVFNKENAQYVKKTLANIERVTGVIAKNSDNIDLSLQNGRVFLVNMANASKDIPGILKEMKTASSNVSSTMVAGKNAVDKISQQTLPPAILVLQKLNAISANLEKVSNAMRQNPSVVIRGTKPLEPGPGE